MKIRFSSKPNEKGFILLLVMVMAACSIGILIGVLHRSSTISLLNLRNNQMTVLNNAAEAATEKVYSQISYYFRWYPGLVSSNISSFATNVPTGTDNAFWNNVTFSDACGNTNRTYVGFLTNYTGPLPAQYPNEFATISPVYRIVSNATMPNSLVPGVVGTAQEDVLLAQVPITTFAIFYNGPLEFSDCATMIVNGRVHSNSYICVGAGSGSSLTFNSLVSCVGTVSAPGRGGINFWTPTDPTTWLTTFNAGYTTNYQSINLSINMTNTHSIIDIPPAGEVPMSPQGQTRLYNEAQVVLIVTNTIASTNPTVIMTLQTAYGGENPGSDSSKSIITLTNATDTYLHTNTATSSGTISPLAFLSLTNSFYDQRQGETNYVTQVDMGKLNTWLGNYTGPSQKFSTAPPDILYVADLRHVASGSTPRQAAVRLTNGGQLPNYQNAGFTVATQNPLYVQGNYNTTVNGVSGNSLGLGSTTNGASVQAALLADAITILSTNWVDNNSANGYGARTTVQNSMTVNAALVTGAMPSTGTTASTFSGGVQNLTRFLENWGNVTLTMNTSIVNLFNSQIATNQFQMPGAYYNPPTRKWGFDTTYYNPGHQPPGIPCALVPIRFNWQTPPPGSITSN